MMGEEIGIFSAGREQLEYTPRAHGLIFLLDIFQDESGCPLDTYLGCSVVGVIRAHVISVICHICHCGWVGGRGCSWQVVG